MGFILHHVLPCCYIPDMHHPLVVTAGQVCSEVLVPGQAAELGAGAELLTGGVHLSTRRGHDGTVLVHANTLGDTCCGEDLQ